MFTPSSSLQSTSRAVQAVHSRGKQESPGRQANRQAASYEGTGRWAVGLTPNPRCCVYSAARLWLLAYLAGTPNHNTSRTQAHARRHTPPTHSQLAQGRERQLGRQCACQIRVERQPQHMEVGQGARGQPCVREELSPEPVVTHIQDMQLQGGKQAGRREVSRQAGMLNAGNLCLSQRRDQEPAPPQ